MIAEAGVGLEGWGQRPCENTPGWQFTQKTASSRNNITGVLFHHQVFEPVFLRMAPWGRPAWKVVLGPRRLSVRMLTFLFRSVLWFWHLHICLCPLLSTASPPAEESLNYSGDILNLALLLAHGGKHQCYSVDYSTTRSGLIGKCCFLFNAFKVSQQSIINILYLFIQVGPMHLFASQKQFTDWLRILLLWEPQHSCCFLGLLWSSWLRGHLLLCLYISTHLRTWFY